ncbi:MAG: bifunctional phosphoribosylaminoimidazolecarboxamide formyltransferase/IMP cyclohydrolase, partial [bacterium]
MLKVKRALISVSDKTGIVEFAKELKGMGVEIISTGGTAKALEKEGIKTADISEVTGFPEMLDGRVKTLHPKVHGGLLALRENKEHMETIEKHGINTIDMVVINLYPFKQVIKKDGITIEETIENIDIGGPSMIRSAAKNALSVAVVTDAADYARVAGEMKDGGIRPETLEFLRVKAFKTTADYDVCIANHLEKVILKSDELTDKVLISAEKKQGLRYGENPHQKASFYAFGDVKETNAAGCEQLHGKELSFNNIYDMDAALSIVKAFDEPAAVVIKHANPCGAAVDSDITAAYKKAFEGDPLSAFGGIAAVNRTCTKGIAEEIEKVFMEVVIAPDFEKEALDILMKKKNIRIIKCGELKSYAENDIKYMDVRKV